MVKETNGENPKFKIGDIIRMSKDKNIFAKSYSPDSFEEVFVIKKSETLGRGHVLLVIVKVKKLLENFTKKNYKIKSRRI